MLLYEVNTVVVKLRLTNVETITTFVFCVCYEIKVDSQTKENYVHEIRCEGRLKQMI